MFGDLPICSTLMFVGYNHSQHKFTNVPPCPYASTFDVHQGESIPSEKATFCSTQWHVREDMHHVTDPSACLLYMNSSNNLDPQCSFFQFCQAEGCRLYIQSRTMAKTVAAAVKAAARPRPRPRPRQRPKSKQRPKHRPLLQGMNMMMKMMTALSMRMIMKKMTDQTHKSYLMGMATAPRSSGNKSRRMTTTAWNKRQSSSASSCSQWEVGGQS